MTDPRAIDEICADQSAWLTRLEYRLAEEKRDRNALISLFYGRRPKTFPSNLMLVFCPDEEL